MIRHRCYFNHPNKKTQRGCVCKHFFRHFYLPPIPWCRITFWNITAEPRSSHILLKKYSRQTNFKTKKIQTTQDGMSTGLFVVGTPCQGLNYWAESQTPAPSPQWDHPVARTTFCSYNFWYIQLCEVKENDKQKKSPRWDDPVAHTTFNIYNFAKTNVKSKKTTNRRHLPNEIIPKPKYQRTKFEWSTLKGIEKFGLKINSWALKCFKSLGWCFPYLPCSPGSPCSPNLLLVLPYRMAGWNSL